VKVILSTLVFFFSASAAASLWIGTKGSELTGWITEVRSANRTVEITWHKLIVPGDDLAFVKAKLGKDIFYEQFRFLGVSGGSMHVAVLRASQFHGKNTSAELNPDAVFFVERASDNNFYLVPSDLKGDGYFRVSANNAMPGTYVVALVEAAR